MTTPLDIFGYIGLIPTLTMFSFPLVTMYQTWRNPEPLGNPVMIDPVLGTFFNCLFWTTYGIAVALPVVIIANAIGFIISLIGLFVYTHKASATDKLRQYKMMGFVCIPSMLLLAVVLVFVPPTAQINALGMISSAGSIVLFLAPLSVVRVVCMTLDISVLPPLPIFGMLASSAWWGLFGILKPDAYIGVVNCIGVFLSMIQVVTYFKYRNATPIAVSPSGAVLGGSSVSTAPSAVVVGMDGTPEVGVVTKVPDPAVTKKQDDVEMLPPSSSSNGGSNGAPGNGSLTRRPVGSPA